MPVGGLADKFRVIYSKPVTIIGGASGDAPGGQSVTYGAAAPAIVPVASTSAKVHQADYAPPLDAAHHDHAPFCNPHRL